MDELVKKFLEHLKLPGTPAAKPFLLGIIGNIGSGKSTVARKLAVRLPGSVHIQTNSARYLLKEAGSPWADNVRQVVVGVIRMLVGQGYGVVLDGGTADTEERDNLAHLATELGVPLAFVRVRCETEVCVLRTQRKYDDASWPSTFDDFRVNTTDKMVANVLDRGQLHHGLQSSDIKHLAADIDGNQPPQALDGQLSDIIAKINAILR